MYGGGFPGAQFFSPRSPKRSTHIPATQAPHTPPTTQEGGFPGGFPGGGFPFPGARFGGGAHRHEEEEEEDVDTTGFYEVLGVGKGATAAEIRKAYLMISKSRDHPRRHPDKGGDPRLFAELQNAYEILSDEDKRAAYDRGGEAATKEGGGGGGGGGPQDLFEMLCV